MPKNKNCSHAEEKPFKRASLAQLKQYDNEVRHEMDIHILCIMGRDIFVGQSGVILCFVDFLIIAMVFH